MAKKNRKNRVEDPNDRTLEAIRKRREKYAKKAETKEGGEKIKAGGATEGIKLKRSSSYEAPTERMGGKKVKRKERQREYFTTPYEPKGREYVKPTTEVVPGIAGETGTAGVKKTTLTNKQTGEVLAEKKDYIGPSARRETYRGTTEGLKEISKAVPQDLQETVDKMDYDKPKIEALSEEVKKGQKAYQQGFETPDVLRETKTKSKTMKGRSIPYKRKTKSKTTKFYDKDYLEANKKELESKKTPYKDKETGDTGYTKTKVTRKGLVTKNVTTKKNKRKPRDGQYRQKGFNKR